MLASSKGATTLKGPEGIKRIENVRASIRDQMKKATSVKADEDLSCRKLMLSRDACALALVHSVRVNVKKLRR